MANTTFNGPVRAEQGFKQITKNATTGAITDNTTIDSSGNLSVGGTAAITGVSTLTGSIIANATTNAIGTTKVQAFGVSLAATNGGTTQYADNDILVEIGDLDATLPTTFANSTAPTHFLIEKVLIKTQVASSATHVGNIQASATSGTATNTAVSSGTEIVGAGAAAIDPFISAAPSVTEIDINLNNSAGAIHVFTPNITLPIATNSLYLCTTTTINSNNFQAGRYAVTVQYSLI
jgi:hypothetical protein